MADNEDLSATSACACDRFDVTRCRADATLQTNNDNWVWGAQNTLFGAYNQQWMMDMASYYSSGEGSAAFIDGGGAAMTQAEMCALEQAFAAAMGAGGVVLVFQEGFGRRCFWCSGRGPRTLQSKRQNGKMDPLASFGLKAVPSRVCASMYS